MRALAYKAKTVLEETGANNLYLALGSLAWELDGRPLRSPLILVPVVLKPRVTVGAYRLTVDESGASTPNYCLLEKLRQLHGLAVPACTSPTEDGAGIDLDAALQAMRIALAERGLPYRVEPTADLAILAFAKFRLWKDLDEHWAELVQQPAGRPPGRTPPPTPSTTRSPTTPPSTSTSSPPRCPVSGRRLAADARSPRQPPAGRSCWRGRPAPASPRPSPTCWPGRSPTASGCCSSPRSAPPWTSSTRRLDAVGMGPFALDLHDKGSRPAVVRAQIRPGAGARRRRSTTRGSPPTARTSARPRRSLRPVRHPAARDEPRRPVAVQRAHRRAQPSANAVAAAAAVARGGQWSERGRR